MLQYQKYKSSDAVDIFKSLYNKCLNIIGVEILLLNTFKFSHQLTNIQYITIFQYTKLIQG
jgi:hypothetical protein